MNRPFRAILNFAHKCAMKCSWCYVPFDHSPANADIVIGIISRIADLGFKNLTIGGGDPFQYSFVAKMLRHAKSMDLFVHVDTHGKGLRQSLTNLYLIENAVDLLGLPLDGSNRLIHDQMRNSHNHFDLVCKRIEWLAPLRSRLKINTVAAALNLRDMHELSEVIKTLTPARWSIYQYWPLGPSASVNNKFGISDAEFCATTSMLYHNMSDSNISLEINSQESRRVTYPIIHHDGNVFVHKAFPHNDFIFLGSIFDKNILKLICSYCIPERPQAVDRYID